jgi:hypothetical protein
MKIECEENPNDLIKCIGDTFFVICEDTEEGMYSHELHPHYINIMDCEYDNKITVHSSMGIDETYKMAETLAKLLNQEYKKV